MSNPRLRYRCENSSCISHSIVYRKQGEDIDTSCKLCHKPMKKLPQKRHYVISDRVLFTTH